MTNKVKLLLDSGAFSAWSRKDPIDIDKYIEFVLTYKDLIWEHVNLDVIVGTLGKRRTFKELDDAARVGYENLNHIKKRGLRPMPVYHQHESLEWLARMIEDGEPYIGLSSAKDLWAAQQKEWLDSVFSLLTDKYGRPLVRTHGFGITNPDLVRRYPWYTVDSTTWTLCAGYGQIIIPQYKDGKPNYMERPLRIVTSGVTHRAGGNQARQFEGYVHLKKEHHHDLVKHFLEEVCGISVAEARYGTTIRRRCMLHYFMGLMHALKNVRYEPTARERGLMSHTGPEARVRKAIAKRQPIDIPHPFIMFATTLSREWSKLMNDVGANTRLLSYYELKSREPGMLKTYVTEGTLGPHERTLPNDRNSEAYRNYRRLKIVKRMQGEANGKGQEAEAVGRRRDVPVGLARKTTGSRASAE